MASKFPIDNQPWLIKSFARRVYADCRPKPKKPTISINDKILVDTKGLMELLDCGKKTAIRIGHEARACVKVDRKLFWNVNLVRRYVDNIAE